MPGISVPRIAIPFNNVAAFGITETIRTPLYGLLYNWYAMSSSNGISPSGFRVATPTEWGALVTGLGGSSVGGGAMKEAGLSHWYTPNTGATNSSEFTALGNGKRTTNGVIDAYFTSLKGGAYFHTKETYTEQWQCWYNNTSSYGLIGGSPTLNDKKWGMAIRCIMIDPSLWYSGMTVTDYDGNIYNTVKIGTQVWLRQNLATTHYSNGVVIPEVTDAASWTALTTHGLCAYENNWSYVFTTTDVTSVPYNALLNDDGTAIINDDGSYILTSD